MNLKKYLPYEHYTLTTKLSCEEVHKRLADNIEPRKIAISQIFKYSYTKPYKGTILDNNFKISRIVKGRNSFLPLITGQIAPVSGRTQVVIKMRLPIFVFTFIAWILIVWLGIYYPPLANLLNIKHVSSRGYGPVDFTPFGIIIFLLVLATISFKPESTLSKKFLAELLEANSYSIMSGSEK